MKNKQVNQLFIFILFVQLLMTACDFHGSGDNDSLYQLFKEPADQYRPGVWWWWNGNALTKEEVTRELQLLYDAGIRAVSIVPMEMPEDVNALPTGYREMEWMSPEWKKMLEYTLEKAKGMNIRVHISIGQGWPLGDILHKYPAQIVITSKKKITGPGNYSGNVWELFQLPKRYKWRKRANTLIDSAIIAFRLIPAKQSQFTPGIDLLGKVKPNGDFFCYLDEGVYNLYITQWQKGYSMTKHNPDNHLILNYLDKQAVYETMDSAYEKYRNIPGTKRLVSLYHDSWELDEQNWTDDFAEEFKARRGYELMPYLPFVSNFYLSSNEPDNAFYDTVQLVRYDFILTIQELFEERTLKPLVKWNNAHGFLCRNQAYGREQHPLDANFYPDIPEGESWFRGEKLTPSMINRYVASAAQYTGRSLITCETNTNVNNIFRVSLDEVKRLTDMTFISGMTQIFLHGYNYSPPQAGIPGWIRYGTFFSEHNTWWPYMPDYTTFIARVSAVLQNSTPQANVAIYTPDADIWKKQSRIFKPFPEEVKPWYIYDLWNAIHSCGYNTNYISDDVISNADIKDGQLSYGNRSFSILILEDVRSISTGTINKIREYVHKGGKIAFIGDLPAISAGYANAKKESVIIKNTVKALINEYPDKVMTYASPEPGNNLVTLAEEILDNAAVKPDLIIKDPCKYITQIHYKKEQKEIFFVINKHPLKDMPVIASMKDNRQFVTLWDPQNGNRQKVKVNNQSFNLTLKAGSSYFLVFDNKETNATTYNYTSPVFNDTLLADQWQVSFMPLVGDTLSLNAGGLADINESIQKDYNDFSGTIVYKGSFEVSENNTRFLKIMAQKSITKLFLNGKYVGTNYFGNHQYDVGAFLHAGSNKIKIVVITTMENYMSGKNTMAVNRWINKGYNFSSPGINVILKDN